MLGRKLQFLATAHLHPLIQVNKIMLLMMVMVILMVMVMVMVMVILMVMVMVMVMVYGDSDGAKYYSS